MSGMATVRADLKLMMHLCLFEPTSALSPSQGSEDQPSTLTLEVTSIAVVGEVASQAGVLKRVEVCQALSCHLACTRCRNTRAHTFTTCHVLVAAFHGTVA